MSVFPETEATVIEKTTSPAKVIEMGRDTMISPV